MFGCVSQLSSAGLAWEHVHDQRADTSIVGPSAGAHGDTQVGELALSYAQRKLCSM
jgi:hypothetical protein